MGLAWSQPAAPVLNGARFEGKIVPLNEGDDLVGGDGLEAG